MEAQKDLRLAVLIDADNVPPGSLKSIMEEVARYGNPTFKRIYGDWTKPQLSSWKKILVENAITPIQQYEYTTGKNSTDSALIIDAMDILYSGRADGFCIVSSDSDFTRLAVRLREAGMKVIGIGEKKTPSSFRVACEKFIYIEIINSSESKKQDMTAEKISKPPKKELISSLTNTINDLADEEGWAYLGDVGNLILKKQPDFDPRNYGYQKLTMLIKNLSVFEIDERRLDNSNVKHIFIRNK